MLAAVQIHLAGHLKMQILLQMPLVGISWQCQLVVFVVRVDDILDNGTRFPQDKVAIVRVLDCGKTSIGIECQERRFFGVLNRNLQGFY